MFGTQEFWNVILCRWVSISWRFETKWCLHLQGQSSETPLEFRFPPRSRWQLHSYGLLRSILVVITQKNAVFNRRGLLDPWWWRHHVLSHRHNPNPETQRHIPEESERHHLCCRTLKSHSIRYVSTVVTLEVVCYWSVRCFVIQDVLGSILVLETDYRTEISSSFYLFIQTIVALKPIRTLQNHDLLTILHSHGIQSGQLTYYCEYHRFARLTHDSFCRCTSSRFIHRIVSPETKSNSQHSEFYL